MAQCHVEEPDRAEGVVRLGRAASLVLLTGRDREAGIQDLMVALAAAARSVADSVSDRGFLSLPRVGLDTWLCAAGVWPHMPQGLFCPVIGYVGGGDIPCVERADQHAGEDVRVC